MSEEKKTVERPEEKQHLDFLTALVLLVVVVVAITLSMGYWQASRAVFYASPGFMPTIIASCIGIMALLLLAQSLKGSSVKERCLQVAAALPATLRSRNAWRAAGGLGMFAVYIFLMLGRMPFWLASFLELAVVLIYLNGNKQVKTILKLLLIAALSVGGIVLLFQVAFSVPMP